MQAATGGDPNTALTMSTVIERARVTRKRATELNTRTGDTTFPVQTKDELLAWMRTRLNGARRVSEIADLSALLLPALDAATEARVLAECPDTIEVLGAPRKVDYRAGVAPRVQLGLDVWESRAWLALPDEVRLPGGRVVEITIQYGSWSGDVLHARSGQELKAAARAKVDERAWSGWSKEGRPGIALPNPAEPTAVVPEIIEACYGTSVIDGAPLMAFGAVVYDHWRTEKFRAEWYRNRTEADAARTEAVAQLESLREEAMKQAKLDAARTEAEAAKEALREFQAREGWNKADYELRRRVEDRRYSYIGSDLESIQAWTEETVGIAAEAEAFFAARAAEAERLAKAEAEGRVLRKVAVTCDTRYNLGKVWVIRPDGSHRTYDDASNATRRETEYVWTNISDELVLIAGVVRVEAAVPTPNGNTGVLWRPPVVTREQIAATDAIEAEHGLMGTFEVDPELVAQRAVMVEELRKEILRMSPDENVEKLVFLDVSRPDGFKLYMRGNEGRHVNHAKPFTASCNGRDAQVVRAVRCGGGVLEFLAYDKWGGWNISACWRSLTEEEKSTPVSAAPAATAAQTPSSMKTTFTHAGNRDFRCACGCCTRLEKNQMVRVQAGEAVNISCNVCGKSGEARKS